MGIIKKIDKLGRKLPENSKIKNTYVINPSPKNKSVFPHFIKWVKLLHKAANLEMSKNNFEYELNPNINGLVVAKIEKTDGTTEKVTLIPLIFAAFPCKNVTIDMLRDLIVDYDSEKYIKLYKLLDKNWNTSLTLKSNKP